MCLGKVIFGAALTTAVIAGATFGSNSANATTIPIDNFSFETTPAPLPLPIGDPQGGSFSIGPIPGWTNSGTSGQWAPGGVGTSNYFFNYLPNGTTIAYSNDVGGTISQTVGNAVVGETYTLSVYVGARSDGGAGVYAVPPKVELLIGGQTLTATGTYPSLGTWADYVASGVASNTGPITIELISNGAQADFDDVQLTGTPLPSTWTMLIAGFVGLGFLAYRGKNRSAALAAA